MLTRTLTVFLLWLALILPLSATSANRVAFVVGNNDYATAPLKNPVNDARAMTNRLSALGFDVIARFNASRRDMQEGLAEFADKLTPDTVALFYFAGHGIQARGRNYLIPIDANINDERGLRFEAVDVSLILDDMGDSNARVKLVVLDACRNNPFESRFRGSSGGLAAIDAAQGTLIAYATSPGAVASDGEGDNGLYTQALLKALDQPGLKVEEVFKQVRTRVASISRGAQVPWESSSLTGDFVFNKERGLKPVPKSGDKDENLFWSSIVDSNEPALFEEYLRRYPEGKYVIVAEHKLKQLRGGSAGDSEPALASLVVRSNVSRDQIFINGKSYGPTSPRKIEVPAGQLNVEVRRQGFITAMQTVTLAAGEEQTVRLTLQREQPLQPTPVTTTAQLGTPKPAPAQVVAAPQPPTPAAVPAPAPAPTADSTAGSTRSASDTDQQGNRIASAVQAISRLVNAKNDQDVIQAARDAMNEFAEDARRIAANPSKTLGARANEFKNMLGYVIDFDAMAKLVLGTHRRTVNIDQYERFLELYKAYLLGSNQSFSSVERWDGRIDITEVKKVGENNYAAAFLLTSKSNTKTKIQFRVRKSKTSGLPYKVYDVVVAGISLIRTQKREFGGILNRDGIDGLNQVLERKVKSRA